MNNKTLTCLTSLAVFFALAGASGWFVYRRVPTTPGAIFGGLIGGILLILVYSWLVAIPVRLAEWWRILRARLGGEPRDGKRTALLGTLRGYGELSAPFSHERCVFYEYELMVDDVSDNERTQRSGYEGFAMVPLYVEHNGERTRLLGKPEVPRLKSTHPNPAAAQSFVEHTTFEAEPAKPEPFAPHDGIVRADYHHPPIATNPIVSRISEQTLSADANVCVVGTYRADQHALLPPLTLRTGSAFAIGAAWRVVNAAIALAIFLGIAVGSAAIFCANYPIDAAEQEHPEWTLQWWEIDLERFVDRNVRMPLSRAGMFTPPGFYLAPVCEGCARGRIEIGGRTIELKHATDDGGKAVHLSERPGARDGVTLIDSNQIVITIDSKRAQIPQSWLQESDIETSLSEGGEYAGRITVIAPHGGIRCRVHFRTHVDPKAWL